jgi:transposase
MAKHFELTITETRFAYARKSEQIAAEAALDGFYVIRTNVPQAQLSDAQAVCAYKSLAQVERAFRSLKTVDLHVRPIFHWSEARVRALIFLCMLAYYLEWHMREVLKPMLHDDEELERQREESLRIARRRSGMYPVADPPVSKISRRFNGLTRAPEQSSA